MQIATATLEGTRKRGRPRKGWRDEGEEDLNVMEILKQAGSEWPGTFGNGGR